MIEGRPDAAPVAKRSGHELVRPRSDVAMVEIDGDGVVYDSRFERVHLLNPTATLVWGLLDGETTLEDLALVLSDASGVESSVIASDLNRLVADLEAEGLLERVGTAPRSPSPPVDALADSALAPPDQGARTALGKPSERY